MLQKESRIFGYWNWIRIYGRFSNIRVFGPIPISNPWYSCFPCYMYWESTFTSLFSLQYVKVSWYVKGGHSSQCNTDCSMSCLFCFQPVGGAARPPERGDCRRDHCLEAGCHGLHNMDLLLPQAHTKPEVSGVPSWDLSIANLLLSDA